MAPNVVDQMNVCKYYFFLTVCSDGSIVGIDLMTKERSSCNKGAKFSRLAYYFWQKNINK